MKLRLGGFVFGTLVMLAACGGGGGGGAVAPGVIVPNAGSLPTSTATATPSPTPSATGISVSGSVLEYTTGAPLSGFTVTVGQVPAAATCLGAESNTSMPCGVPAAPTFLATTGAGGAFMLAVPVSGTYMLTIGKDATYATLHRTIAVTGSALSLGTLHVAALSSDEQNWVADINHQRATVSFPVSFSNLVVDEYAEEQARAEVAAIVSGVAPYGDATEQKFNVLYYSSPGTIYGAASVADLVGSSSGFLIADQQWMSENKNCPSGNWQTCVFADDTGHYINISATGDVWLGIGESTTSFADPPYGNEWAYAVIFPANNALVLPALRSRVYDALSRY